MDNGVKDFVDLDTGARDRIGGCEERAEFEEAGGKEGLRKLVEDCLYFDVGTGRVTMLAGEGMSSRIAGESLDWGLFFENIRVIGCALAREKLGEY